MNRDRRLVLVGIVSPSDGATGAEAKEKEKRNRGATLSERSRSRPCPAVNGLLQPG
jgi:hypothetical protein